MRVLRLSAAGLLVRSATGYARRLPVGGLPRLLLATDLVDQP